MYKKTRNYERGTGQRLWDKSSMTKSPPHNELIIQSYYIFYIDCDIKDILKGGFEELI